MRAVDTNRGDRQDGSWDAGYYILRPGGVGDRSRNPWAGGAPRTTGDFLGSRRPSDSTTWRPIPAPASTDIPSVRGFAMHHPYLLTISWAVVIMVAYAVVSIAHA